MFSALHLRFVFILVLVLVLVLSQQHGASVPAVCSPICVFSLVHWPENGIHTSHKENWRDWKIKHKNLGIKIPSYLFNNLFTSATLHSTFAYGCIVENDSFFFKFWDILEQKFKTTWRSWCESREPWDLRNFKGNGSLNTLQLRYHDELSRITN